MVRDWNDELRNHPRRRSGDWWALSPDHSRYRGRDRVNTRSTRNASYWLSLNSIEPA
ncbi:hypothetical protein Y717_07245 [Streptomyces scopuliridis RB72]|uniref:Uncharacterized protein n=1 Tax=Streptomyces scopuliridis RB72 TaxID=1440053 RepID=A0A2T7TA72_9ACTN|nr:hypothetical protein Y717_07245 [Streptomyces scopuliridis RB72]